MFYKNWPYWLKGAVISEIILFILFFLANVPNMRIFDLLLFYILTLFGFLTAKIYCLFANCPLYMQSEGFFESFMIKGALIFCFVIGAVFGFIYGKIKNKLKKIIQ